MILNRRALTDRDEADLKQCLGLWLDDMTELCDPNIGTAPI